MADEKIKEEFDLEEVNDDKKPKSTLVKKVLWYAGAVIVVLLAALEGINYLVNKGIEKNISNEKLEKIIATQLVQKTQNDSIFANIKAIKILVGNTNETVTGLSNSYVLFMQTQKDNKALTSDQFRNYMEGITWEVKKK